MNLFLYFTDGKKVKIRSQPN